MNLAKPLFLIHRSGLFTLPTMTYTSMQGFGYVLDIALRDMLGRDKE